MDALNPRTSNRELPRGAMSIREAALFVVVASIAFAYSSWRLSPLCFTLSPVALAIVFWYSLAKRYTTWTQMFLGLAMAVAPVGGVAVGAETLRRLRGASVEQMGPTTVKGKREPVEAYLLKGLSETP